MDKEVHSQQRHQIGQGPAQLALELEVSQNQHSDQRCPNLDVQRVGASANEGLDLQILLERLEQQLDLPSLPVNGSNGQRREVKLIGEQDQFLARLGNYHHDAPQHPIRIKGSATAGQSDDLIAFDL